MKKLMVREIKEIIRSITTEKSCMFHILRTANEHCYTDTYIDIIKQCLYNEHGFLYITNTPCGATSELGFAVFKKITEREATNNEKIAYHYLNIYKVCNSNSSCDNCICDGMCPICDVILTSKCEELTKGKEFYEVDI